MNTLKTVFGKLFKEETTNLSSHEVELGFIEDFNGRIDKANNERKTASVHYQKLIGTMQNAVIHLELALKEADKIDKAAKEIGIQSPVNKDRVNAKLTEYKKVVSALENLTIKGADNI
jgi:hypothetical protein